MLKTRYWQLEGHSYSTIMIQYCMYSLLSPAANVCLYQPQLVVVSIIKPRFLSSHWNYKTLCALSTQNSKARLSRDCWALWLIAMKFSTGFHGTDRINSSDFCPNLKNKKKYLFHTCKTNFAITCNCKTNCIPIKLSVTLCLVLTF